MDNFYQLIITLFNWRYLFTENIFNQRMQTGSLSDKRKKFKQALLKKEKIWNLGPNYKIMRMISSSKTSQVAIGCHISGKQVAIKRIINPVNSHRQLLGLLRQISLMNDLRNHSNIVQLYDFKVAPDFSQAFLIMEFIDSDLKKLMQSNQSLQAIEVQYITLQLLLTIQYMKKCGVLHRDLKPENILIQIQSHNIKICDFGLSRTVIFEGQNAKSEKQEQFIQQQYQQMEEQVQKHKEGDNKETKVSSADKNSKLSVHVVTRWYRAPQVIVCQGIYGIQIDIWSVGCIFGQLLKMLKQNAKFPTQRVPLFPGKACYPLSPPKDKSQTVYQKINNFPHSVYDQLNIIFQIIGTPEKQDLQFIKSQKAIAYIKSFVKRDKRPFENLFNKISPQAVDFLNKILLFNPKKRMTIDQAINHPLFQNVRKRFIREQMQGKVIKPVQKLPQEDMKVKLLQYASYYQQNNFFAKKKL